MVSDEFEEEAEVNYFIIIFNFGRKYFAIVDLKNNWRGVWNKALSDFWYNVKFS